MGSGSDISEDQFFLTTGSQVQIMNGTRNSNDQFPVFITPHVSV